MIYTPKDKSIQYMAKDIFNLAQGLGYKAQWLLSTGHSILIPIWPAGAWLSPFLFTRLKTFFQIKFHLAGQGDLAAHTQGQAQAGAGGCIPYTG